MKIGYFADGPWSHLAFEKINQDESLEISFIVPRTDTSDFTLRKYAEEFDIAYLSNSKVNSPEFLERATSFDCDLFVSMSFNQIFRKRITNLPRLKTINCHAGKLPFYRGRNILNWVLINDEKEFGITVHYIDEGIDTGDILLQRSFPITDEDDYSTLLQVSHSECANILYDAIKLIQRDEHKPVNQKTIHPIGNYFGVRTFGDEVIDWSTSSRHIFNFIRAICAPGPKARTFLGNEEVFINKAEIIDSAPNYINTTGQIVGKNDRGIVVKTGTSTILITDYASIAKLKVGDRLHGPICNCDPKKAT